MNKPSQFYFQCNLFSDGFIVSFPMLSITFTYIIKDLVIKIDLNA